MCQLCVLIKKYNKSIENDKISNRRDNFSEQIEVENPECAEDLEKKEEVRKNNMTKEIEKEQEK